LKKEGSISREKDTLAEKNIMRINDDQNES